MKYRIFNLAFLISILANCNETKDIETISVEEIVEQEPVEIIEVDKLMQMLDKGHISKAKDYIYKLQTTRTGIDQLSFLLFDCSHSRYNASRIIDDGKTITLQGNFWIRSGDHLINGMPDDNSYVIIHKKTMLIIRIEGEYEQSHLLNN